jgi:hypothetical protein
VARIIVVLATGWLGGCGSSSAGHDASVDASDGTAPRDGQRDAPAPRDARDGAVVDGSGSGFATVACAGASCVVGQQYCSTFEDLRPDGGGHMTAACVALPPSCAAGDAQTNCQCVLDTLTQCREYNSCVTSVGVVTRIDCQWTQ